MTTIALIGSFRKHYNIVLEYLEIFKKSGLDVLSPRGTPIIRPGIPFVRFTSDPPHYEDDIIQTITLQRIFKADLTYVISPNGYVGRTTCYEIGRIIQADRPLYFSADVNDLPIRISKSHILSPDELVSELQSGTLIPEPLFIDTDDGCYRLERGLIDEY